MACGRIPYIKSMKFIAFAILTLGGLQVHVDVEVELKDTIY